MALQLGPLRDHRCGPPVIYRFYPIPVLMHPVAPLKRRHFSFSLSNISIKAKGISAFLMKNVTTMYPDKWDKC